MSLCHFSCSGLNELKPLTIACLLLAYCIELCAMNCPYSGAEMRVTLSDESLETDGNYPACYEEDGYFHSFFLPQTDWANENPDPLPDFYFNTHSSSLNLYLSNDTETFFLPVTLSEFSEIVVRKIDSASPDRFFLYFLWPVTKMSYEVVSGGYCECYANSSEVLECFFESEQEIIRLKTEVPLYRPATASKSDENPLGRPGDDSYPPSYLLILQSRLQKTEPLSEKKSLPMPGWFLSQSYRRPGAWLDDTLSDIGTRVSGWYKEEVARQNRFIEVYMYGQDGNEQKDDETPRSKPLQQSRQKETSQTEDENPRPKPPQLLSPGGRSLSDKNGKESAKKRLRRDFTPDQKKALEDVFTHDTFPLNNKRQKLAATLDVTADRVKKWFENRRAKWKRENPGHTCLHQGTSAAMARNQSPAPGVIQADGSAIMQSFLTSGWGGTDPSVPPSISPYHNIPPHPLHLSPYTPYPPYTHYPPYSHYLPPYYPPPHYGQASPQAMSAPSLVPPISSQAQHDNDGAAATSSSTGEGLHEFLQTIPGLSSHPAPSLVSENWPTPDSPAGNKQEDSDDGSEFRF